MRLFALLLLLCACQSEKYTPLPPPLPRAPEPLIHADKVEAKSLVISVLVPQASSYTYVILFDSTVLKTPPLEEKPGPSLASKTVTLRLEGLMPESTYNLKISDPSGLIIAEREFKTAPAPKKKKSRKKKKA